LLDERKAPLVYTRSRNAKLKLIGDYLKRTPDPDRGYALAALTGELDLPAVKPAAIRAIAEERVDPVLLLHEPRLCRRHGRDGLPALAEAERAAGRPRRRHAAPVERWSSGSPRPRRGAGGARRDARPSRCERPLRFAQARDRRAPHRHLGPARQDRAGRGVRARRRRGRGGLARHRPALTSDLFDWAEGRGAQPTAEDVPVFRPFMLAHPLEETRVSLADYAAEWKWDGIRVQLVHAGGETRLYSRAGDDITGSFPDVAEASGARRARRRIAGEGRASRAPRKAARRASTRSSKGSGRKNVSAKMLGDYPAFVRLYDILFDGSEDVRGLPWTERRGRLEAFAAGSIPERFDVSALIEAESFEALEEIRAGARDASIEGVMLKRRDSLYVAGRRTGLWYKWKRDPLVADCVLMYAARGQRQAIVLLFRLYVRLLERERRAAARRQGLFRLHRRGIEMARPLRAQPYGPTLRAGARGREEAWSSKSPSIRSTLSKRHKSGLAMRFPRISRIRTDKPAAEADRIETLRRMAT
jgi:DNA ligase-1